MALVDGVARRSAKEPAWNACVPASTMLRQGRTELDDTVAGLDQLLRGRHDLLIHGCLRS
jgi:hypothetical protein